MSGACWSLRHAVTVTCIGQKKSLRTGVTRHSMECFYQALKIISHSAFRDFIKRHRTPITEYYPPENKELQDLIAEKYLLVSQVPIWRYSKQDYLL